MSGFLRRISVVLLVIAACFAGVRIYAAGTGSSSSLTYTLNDDGAKIAAVPHSFAIGSVTQLSSLPYKPGYGFAGYYTGSSCSGNQIIDYTGTVLISLDSSTTLYACWRALNPIWDNTPLVVLSDNGGSGGAFASSCGTDFWTYSLHNEYVSYGHRGDWAYIDMPRGDYWWVSPCTMTYSTVTTMASLPTRSGYTFNGYYTGQNGTGTQVVYANGNLVDADTLRNVLSSSVPTTIYAYWTVDYSGHYHITLNDAGGSGSQVSSLGTEYNLYESYGECYESGTGLNMSTGAPLNAVCITSIYATPTKTGYNFGGYYTGQNGSGVPIINASGTVVGSNTYFTAPATIYAKWTPKVLSVKLEHQSPTNSPAPDTVYLKYATGWYSNVGATTSITHMTTVPTKTNYTFGGYWTGQNGSGTRVIDTDGNFIYTTAALTALSTNGSVYAYWTSSVAQPTWVTVTLNDKNGTTNPTRYSSPTKIYRNTNTAVANCSGWRSSQSCNASAVITSITPPALTNYIYGGHYTGTSGGGTQVIDANGNISSSYAPVSNVTINAKWTTSGSGTVYRITLNPNSGNGTKYIYERNGVGWYTTSAGTVQITSSIFNPTSSGGANLSKPTRTNYTFNGYWTGQGTSGSGSGTKVIDANGNILASPTYNANTTFYAGWTQNATTSSVTLDPNNGTACSVTSVTAINGSPMPTLTCAPTRTNYVFTGYFDARTGGTQYYNADLTSARNWDKTGAQTLYAQWEEQTYNIYYYCDKRDVELGVDGASYTDYGVTYGQDYIFKTRAAVGCSPLSGKKFLGWTDDEHGNSILYQPGQVATYPYHSDARLMAYDMDIMTVTLNHGDPDNTPSPSTVYLVPTDAWYNDSNATNEISTMTTVPVKYGYDFVGYYGLILDGTERVETKIIDENGDFINVPRAALMESDLDAHYSAKKYPFTLNDASATTASAPNPVTYIVEVGWINTSGTTITSITIPTKTGNSFAGFWTGPNGTGTKIINADGTFVTITDSILQEFDENNVDTLYAKWNPKNTVTFSCQNQAGNGSGTPSPATVYVADGETLIFPSMANCSWGNAGYSPYMWGVVSGNSFTDTHDAGDTITWDSSWGDRTYNVWYAPNYFNYEYSCGAGSGTPPASGNTYYHNGGWKTAVNTCTAPANKHFVGWKEPVSGVTYAENTTPTGGGWIWPYNVTAAAGGAFVAQYADDTYTAHFTCENNTLSPYVFSGTAPADITDVAYQSSITLPSPNVCTNNYPDAGWIVSPATEWLYSCTDANGGALGSGTAGAGSWTWPKQGNCTFRPNALYSTYHIYYYCDGTTNTVSLDQTVDYTNRDTVRPATATAAGCSTPTGHHFTGWKIGATNTTLQPGQYGGSNALWPYAQSTSLRAQWAPDTYNLTWSCGEGSGTPSGAAFPTSINYGDTLTFPANTVCAAPTGHAFTGWVIDINATEYAPNSTFTWNLTGGSAITAHYEPVKVNITYSCGTGATGTTPAAQNNISYGSSVTLRALGNCAMNGFYATRWLVSNTSPTDNYEFGATVDHWNYTENKNLVPNWTAQTYTITYELNGGTPASSGMPTSYTYGTTTTINGVPTLVGAEFAGWCDTESLTNCAMTKTISATTTGNKKFWAKWTCKTGYESNDIWLTAPVTVSDYSASGHTVYPAGAACIPGRYHINCNGNGGVACLEQVTSGNASNPQLHLGQFYGVRTAYGTGYDIVPGLATVFSTTQSDIESIINNNGGFYAFTKNPAYKTQVGVDTAYAASTYQGFIEAYANAYNSSAVFGRDHYTFNGLWSAAEGGTQYLAPNTNFGNLINTEAFSKSWLSDTTVYAQWIPDVYTITLNDTQNGGSGGDGVIYEKYETGFSKTNFGTTIQSVTKPTKTGYTFTGYWTSANGGTRKIPANGALPAASTFGESTTLYAQFSANKYDVNYDCDADGTSDYSNEATYDSLYTVLRLNEAGCGIKIGHTFQGWSVSGTSLIKNGGDTFTWAYTTDKTLTAIWTPDIYHIEFNFNNGVSGNVAQVGTPSAYEKYSVGWGFDINGGNGSTAQVEPWTQETITLPRKEGYTFVGYYANQEGTGTRYIGPDAHLPAATSFAMDKTLYAKWEKANYTVTYKNGGGTGDDVVQDVTYDTQFTTKPGSIFTKTNSVVTKWNTTSGGTYPNLNSNYTYSTAGNTVLTANWGECTCTKGTHVALCNVTSVANNTCQYSYTCEAGYNNAGATSGTFNGAANTAANTSPNCGGANSYTITVTAGNGISKVAASGWTNSGTATMTKTFDFGDPIDLSTVVTATQKSGYTGAAYTVTNGEGSISGNVYTVGAGNGTITVSATGITTPAGVTITGGTTKVYNLSETTLTGATTTTYDSGITVKYSFGYAPSSNGTYSNWTTASTTKTTSIAKDAFLGTRYYKVRVTASDGTLTSTTTTATTPTTMTLDQKKITFNATTNGGTLSGTSPLYVRYDSANVYTGATSGTTGTVPTASKTGYTFNGWYTAQTGGYQIYNASGTLTSATVPGYTGSSKWRATEDKTLYAQFSANTNTPYKVYHYTKNLTGTGYTLNGAVDNLTGTSNASVTLESLARTLPGFTYDAGFEGTATHGTTKPSSGAVTTTTILPDGTRIIDLYYNRNSYTITYKNGGGVGADVTQTGISYMGSFKTKPGTTFTKTNSIMTGWDTTSGGNYPLLDHTYSEYDTAGDTVLTAAWATCGCTPGTGVASCTTSATATNTCAATVTCASGYDQSTATWSCSGAACSSSCSADDYEITLDNANATTNGTAKIYTTYGVNVYLDADRGIVMTTSANPITTPKRVYTVTYNGNNGTVGTTTAANTTATYTFKGYYSAATNGTRYIVGSTGRITSDGITAGKGYSANATWYAQWTSASVTLPNATRAGYTFAGWYDNATSGNLIGAAGATYTPTEDKTLYAHWNECTAGNYCDGTGTVTSCSTATNGKYPHSEAGASSINDCYLTTTAGKYVATAGAGEVQCVANDYCAGGVNVYYGGTHSTIHPTKGGNASCSSGTDNKYNYSEAGTSTVNNCYLTLTTGKYVATAGAGMTNCAANNYSDDTTTKVYYGGTASSSHPTTSSCAACSTLGGGLYNKSAAGSASTGCYVTTTAGKYIIANTDTAQTTCPVKKYCESATIYWPNVGQIADCPVADATTAMTSYPSNYYNPTRLGISNQGWSTGLTSISACMANYTFSNTRGNFTVESVKYNTTTGKYDNGGSKYYSKINAGYYGNERYSAAYCNTATHSMIYKDALPCPAGSYCPGLTSMPLCSSGTYAETIGLYSCPTNYPDSAAMSTSINACYLTTTAGKYVATAGAGEVQCTANNYCTGGVVVHYDETGGITACSTGAGSNYATSAAGSDSNTDCYKTVTLDKNGGSGTIQGTSGTNPASVVCHYNTECNFGSASDLVQTGYTFSGGWGTTSTCSGTTVKFTVPNDTGTYYACKSADCNEITVDNTTRGGTTANTKLYKKSGDTKWYSDSSCQTAVTTTPRPSKTNATFSGYYTSATNTTTRVGTNANPSVLSTTWTVTEPTTIYAHYNCNTGWQEDGTDIAGTCIGTISATASDKSLTYNGTSTTNGTAQSCANVTETSPSGTSTSYAFANNGSCSGVTYGSDVTMTNVSEGTKTVCYKVTKTNYADKTGEYTCTMNAATPSYTKTNKTKVYDGTALSCEGVSLTGTGNKPTNGIIKYSSSQTGAYTTTVPTQTNVGSQTVWFKVSGTNFVESAPDSFTCSVTAATMNPTPSNNNKTYDGTALTCNGNTWSNVPSGSTKYYSTDGGNTYSTTAPTRTAAGTTTVNWKVTNPNYSDKTGTFTCTVAKADCGVTLSKTSDTTTYNTAKTFTASTASGCSLSVSPTSGSTNVAIASITNGTVTVTPQKTGSQTVTVTASADGNHNNSSATYKLTVNPADFTVTEPTSHLTYNGTATSNGTAQTCPGVTVSNLVGGQTATIKYGTASGTYNNSTPSSITNAGDVTVYYQVTAPNHNTQTGEYTCTMDPRTSVASASDKALTYDGTAQSCANVTLTYPTNGTIKWKTSASGNYGATVPTMTNVSESPKTIYYQVSGTNFTTITGQYQCTMAKADCTVSLNPTSGTTSYPNTKTFTASTNSGGTLSVSPTSGSTNVAIASISNGTVTATPQKTGTQTITVTSAATSNYKSCSADYKLTVTDGGITHDVSDVNKVYDGTPLVCNGVTNVVPSGAVVKYRTATSGAYNLTSAPSITNVADSKTIYYQITADNYEPVTGRFTCTVTKADCPITVKEGNTTLTSSSVVTLTYPTSKTLTATSSCGNAVTLSSGNLSYITVSDKTLNPVKVTSSNITMTASVAESANYNGATASFKAKVNRGTCSITLNPTSGSGTCASNTATFAIDKGSCNGTITASSSDEDIATVVLNSAKTQGTVTRVSAGSATITVNVAQTDQYNATSAEYAFSGNKVAGSTTIKDGTETVSSGSVTYPNTKTLTATCAGGATPTISNAGTTSVATATISDGTITMTPLKQGTSTITVSCPATDCYNASTATYKLTVNRGDCSITLNPTSGTITYPTENTATFTIDKGSCNGTITASSGDTNIATVALNSGATQGTVSYVAPGTATITVSSAQTDQYNAESATYEVTNQLETYTITFRTGNKTMGTQSCTYGQNVTLNDVAGMSNIPVATNKGWGFDGWASNVNTTNTDYANKGNMTCGGNVTLYGVWKRDVKFTYFETAASTTNKTSTNQQYYRNTTTSAAGVSDVTTYPLYAQSDYAWSPLGWATTTGATSASISQTDATTTTVTPGATTGTSAGVAYYAVYSRTPQIAYNGNNNTGGSTANTNCAPQTFNAGATNGSIPTCTLANNGFTRTGYTFNKWAAGSAAGIQYSQGDSYTFANKTWTSAKTYTMYATWTANTYSIAYTLNGGAYGANHPSSATFDAQFTVNNPTHEHATFKGWNISNMDTTTHTYGAQTTNTTTLSGVTATTFKNLRSTSGTVTFTATWNCDTGYTGTNCDAIDYNMQYVCEAEPGWNYTGSAPVATNPVHYGQSVQLAGDVYAQTNGCRKVWGTSGDADYCNDCFTFGGWTIDAESTAIPTAPVHAANSTVNQWGRTNTTDWCIISDTGNCEGFADDIFYVAPVYTPKQYNIEYMYATSPVSGASANMPASYTYTTETTISNADQTAPAHATFNGWCTGANGTGTCFAAGQPITIGNRDHGDMRYYANWSCDTGYTLTYDANNQPVCSANTYNIDYVFNGGITGIPAEYTPVEYIQSNGSSYLNTGVAVNNNIGVYIDFQYANAVTSESILFGTVSPNLALWRTNSSFSFAHKSGTGNSYSITVPSDQLQARHSAWINFMNDHKIKFDETTTSLATTSFSSSKQLYIFAANYSGAYHASTARVYGMKISNGNGLIRDYVPVRQGNTCGLYDVVNGTYLSGSGFTCPDTEYIGGYPDSYTYGVGADITGVPTRAHSTFVGWCENSGLTNNCVTPQNVSTTAMGDKTFYAKWACNAGYTANAAGTACNPNTIALSYRNGGHGTAPTAPASCVYGENVNLPAAITETGYTFNKWAVADNNFAANATIVCNSANLGVTSGTAIITATWTTDSITCAEKKYLPAGATVCVNCIAGGYCPGGTFTYNPNLVQGITVCATNTYSNAAAAQCTACLTANGYQNSGDEFADHAYESSCKTTCAVGQCVATARAACTNVGTTGWATGGVVAQGNTLACNVCQSGTSTCGYGACADEAGDCGRVLHVGANKLYLRSDRKTDRTLNVKIGNNIYYANMSPANLNMSNGVNKSFKIKVGNAVYSIYDDSMGE